MSYSNCGATVLCQNLQIENQLGWSQQPLCKMNVRRALWLKASGKMYLFWQNNRSKLGMYAEKGYLEGKVSLIKVCSWRITVLSTRCLHNIRNFRNFRDRRNTYPRKVVAKNQPKNSPQASVSHGFPVSQTRSMSVLALCTCRCVSYF